MSIDEAKEKIEELEQVVHLYVIHENVTTVMGIVNERGYHVGKRNVLTTDISDILRARPTDAMQELAGKLFRKISGEERADDESNI
ncbi:MAG: hypothetical protein ABS948_08650 [Solibacillus sp.]